jgi:hypothetical protein
MDDIRYRSVPRERAIRLDLGDGFRVSSARLQQPVPRAARNHAGLIFEAVGAATQPGGFISNQRSFDVLSRLVPLHSDYDSLV